MKTRTLLLLTFLAIASISCDGTADDSRILTEDQTSSSSTSTLNTSSTISSTSITETTSPSVTTHMMVDYVDYYDDFEELSRTADVIALGIIGGIIKVDYINYSTDFSFRISRIIKGEAGEEITIHQAGAPGITVMNDPNFEEGEEYVLFLHETKSGTYYTLGGPHGRFAVIDNQVFSMNKIYRQHVSIPRGLECDGVALETFLDNILGYIDYPRPSFSSVSINLSVSSGLPTLILMQSFSSGSSK